MIFVKRVCAGRTRTASTERALRRALVGVLAALLVLSAIFMPQPQQATAATAPNIILITTDDMSKTDLQWMPKTQKLLGDAGVEIDDFISNHPLCCPARAEIITGQYGHNNGVWSNGGEHGGYYSLEDRANHIGTWLQSAGYKTALVGKHLNGWPAKAEHQEGWTIFDPSLNGVYNPYDVTMWNNNNPRLYEDIHTSDLMGRLTVKYINQFARSEPEAPFFIWTSQVAPHAMWNGEWVPPIPAERHQDLYPNAVPPSLSDPAYNEEDVSDKPPYVQMRSKVSTEGRTMVHRARIRSLAAVDEQVEKTVEALRDAGELDNTYIFFTSDNGWLMGEHRLLHKNKPYEQSLQVPLLVRGPGLEAGKTAKEMYSLVDLAPTFLELAGATPGRTLDGRSMLATLSSGDLLSEVEKGYGHYLIQAATQEGWWWKGVRSNDYVYVRYEDGFEELYDMAIDPDQLENKAYSLDSKYQVARAEYAEELARLESCSGQTCQTGGSLPSFIE